VSRHQYIWDRASENNHFTSIYKDWIASSLWKSSGQMHFGFSFGHFGKTGEITQNYRQSKFNSTYLHIKYIWWNLISIFLHRKNSLRAHFNRFISFQLFERTLRRSAFSQFASQCESNLPLKSSAQLWVIETRLASLFWTYQKAEAKRIRHKIIVDISERESHWRRARGHSAILHLGDFSLLLRDACFPFLSQLLKFESVIISKSDAMRTL
jgi:hypothetical protein